VLRHFPIFAPLVTRKNPSTQDRQPVGPAAKHRLHEESQISQVEVDPSKYLCSE